MPSQTTTIASITTNTLITTTFPQEITSESKFEFYSTKSVSERSSTPSEAPTEELLTIHGTVVVIMIFF